MDDDYMCPFCVTPWKCNGPHINQDDMPNFDSYINECEQRALDSVREAIVALPTFEKPYPWCGDVQHCGGDDSVELNAVLDTINALQDKS